MCIAQSRPLFAWDCLVGSPSLQTLSQLLAAIPDGRLLGSLRSARTLGKMNLVPIRKALREAVPAA